MTLNVLNLDQVLLSNTKLKLLDVYAHNIKQSKLAFYSALIISLSAIML